MFQTDLLADKRILVTGGGTGLGKSMGKRFLELGAELVICGRREEVLEETALEFDADHPARTQFRHCDIRDPGSVEEFVEWCWDTGGVDGLVNNAAGNFIARTETLSPRAVDAVLGIVAHGTAYMTLACGKRWLAQDRAGTVLSIVATYAWTGSPYVVPSAMGKAAVLAMTRSLAVEWGPRNIRLNAVAPGPFPTPGAWDRLVPDGMEDAALARNPLGRVGEPLELANLAAYLMSDHSGYVNGDCITIDGGATLKDGANFSHLENLTEEQWDAMRARPKR